MYFNLGMKEVWKGEPRSEVDRRETEKQPSKKKRKKMDGDGERWREVDRPTEID